MLPIVPYSELDGPFTRTKVNSWGGLERAVVYRRERKGSRQKRPYDIPTSYRMLEYRLISGWTDAGSWSWTPEGSATHVAAVNLARQRFVNKLGDSSSFGATLTAELKETWGTVVSIITRAALAARYVKRGAFFQAAEVLGLPYRERLVTRKRKRTVIVSRKNGLGKRRVKVTTEYSVTRISWGDGREHAKTAASGWLMWSYGVKPLMSDIHNGMEVLTRELPSSLVVAYGSKADRVLNVSGNSSYLYVMNASVKIQAYIRVSNPNLWLANQLGLINPVQWINEAIPFSFVVDWFSNLSQIISQMTDFAGLTLLDPCTSTKLTGQQGFAAVGNEGYLKQVKLFTRLLTTPSAKLVFAYERFQWQRGLNAISLLIGFTGRGK